MRSYRPLGNTGIQMSDISFGGAGIADPDVVTRAVERGINYFDTSPDYSQTGSEQVIGKALKPHRDKVYIASKFCTADGHLPQGHAGRRHHHGGRRQPAAPADRLPRRLHHPRGEQPRPADGADVPRGLRSPEASRARCASSASAATRRTSKRSCGTPSTAGRFDMMLVAYNFNNWPDLTTIFHDAKQRGVGVVAMKTLKGAKATRAEGLRRPVAGVQPGGVQVGARAIPTSAAWSCRSATSIRSTSTCTPRASR